MYVPQRLLADVVCVWACFPYFYGLEGLVPIAMVGEGVHLGCQGVCVLFES